MTTIDPSSSQDLASDSASAPASAPSSSPATFAEATEQPSPATTPFDWIGGEPAVRTLVDRFYDLMDLEPAYKELRAAHGTTLADARDKLFWFLCGWLGGPDHYIERFGHPRLRMRHMPFSIGIKERDQWVACMDQAMGEIGVPEALRMRLRESFMGTADWMRNRGG